MNNYITDNGIYQTLNMILSRNGDISMFYVAISLGSFFLGYIILLNVVRYCYKYYDYWWRMHTGNHFLVTIWSATPNKHPLLNFTELKTYEELQIYIQQEQARHCRELAIALPNQPVATQPR